MQLFLGKPVCTDIGIACTNLRQQLLRRFYFPVSTSIYRGTISAKHRYMTAYAIFCGQRLTYFRIAFWEGFGITYR